MNMAQPKGRAAAYADFVLHLPAQTMADDQGDKKTSTLPMGSLYEGALFVLFEVMILKLVKLLKVTPEGFPLSYEVMGGGTADSTTLSGFLERIEHRYGRANRIWVMDRGIPGKACVAVDDECRACSQVSRVWQELSDQGALLSYRWLSTR